MTATGFLEVICVLCVLMTYLRLCGDQSDVTDDYETAACFELGRIHTLEHRLPSTPDAKTDILFTTDGSHHGWVREASRPLVEDVIQAGKVVICRPESYGIGGRRWTGVYALRGNSGRGLCSFGKMTRS
jgi:hypothetical protein